MQSYIMTTTLFFIAVGGDCGGGEAAEEEDGDPAIVVIHAPADSIHAALSMPVLQVGKLQAYLLFFKMNSL